MIRGVVRRAVDVIGGPMDALGASPDPEAFVALIYHRVGGRTPSTVDLPEGAFRDQLDALAGQVVDLDLALGGAATGGPRRPSVVLTFDDGTVDWPDVAMPALLERGLPATFYVSTDFVERGVPFPDDGTAVSWSGLSDMLSTGLVTIGSHTHTHRVMARVSAQEAADEVDRSIGLIEDRLGVTPRHFAYPKAIAPSAAAEVVVRRRFDTAVLAGNRVNRPGTDPYRLGRHALTTADDRVSFDRKIGGGMLLEGWLRERRDALTATDY